MLWCFVAVVAMSVVKIIQMAVVQQQRANNPTDELHCNQFFDNKTKEEISCSKLPGCYWNASVPSGNTKCSMARCFLLEYDECRSENLQHYCTWDGDDKECKDLAQRFDTMSLFVVLETLIMGFGLLATLWQGMLANEIKKEAFSYVIRMKYSELLSNAMSFVSERAHWERHMHEWRIEEVKLLSIVRKLRELSEELSELDGRVESDDQKRRDIEKEIEGDLSLSLSRARCMSLSHRPISLFLYR